MSKMDLEEFFRHEVPGRKPGDDRVDRFAGAPYREGHGVEALLDVEFMMGVAPGVKTEFWEWPNNDFCADLHNYSRALLKPGGPLVNSISYGWQGDLKQVGCHEEDQKAVDVNWAKLAAAGITVFISSGDRLACPSTADEAFERAVECGRGKPQLGLVRAAKRRSRSTRRDSAGPRRRHTCPRPPPPPLLPPPPPQPPPLPPLRRFPPPAASGAHTPFARRLPCGDYRRPNRLP